MHLGDGTQKRNDLKYGDLHGIPCLLILCEKGRMGDTFPQTFGCLDLRIRTSDNATTFVQELGRLCRYPTTSSSKPSPLNVSNCALEAAITGKSSSEVLNWQWCSFQSVVQLGGLSFAGALPRAPVGLLHLEAGAYNGIRLVRK